MSKSVYIIVVIAIAAVITFLLRLFPFVVFSKINMPPKMQKVVKLMPAAIIAVLVIYCLKDLAPSEKVSFNWIKTAITIGSCLFVALLHFWKKNTLLSIAGGTILYMILIRVVPL